MLGGVENTRIRLNSAPFQLKLPAGAELGNIRFPATLAPRPTPPPMVCDAGCHCCGVGAARPTYTCGHPILLLNHGYQGKCC